ncbi:MAG: hypothetical protein RSH25_17255, partial [Bacteroides sp.]
MDGAYTSVPNQPMDGNLEELRAKRDAEERGLQITRNQREDVLLPAKTIGRSAFAGAQCPNNLAEGAIAIGANGLCGDALSPEYNRAAGNSRAALRPSDDQPPDIDEAFLLKLLRVRLPLLGKGVSDEGLEALALWGAEARMACRGVFDGYADFNFPTVFVEDIEYHQDRMLNEPLITCPTWST